MRDTGPVDRDEEARALADMVTANADTQAFLRHDLVRNAAAGASGGRQAAFAIIRPHATGGRMERKCPEGIAR